MDCDDVYALLDAYVDRELDVAHDLAIATHLQTCQRCAQRYEALLTLQVALRTRGTYFASPPSLRQRLRTTLRRTAPAPFLKRSEAVLTAVGLLVLVLGGVFMWLHWSPPTLADGLVREVVAAHVRSSAGRSSHGRRLHRYAYAQTLVERPARVCAPGH